MWEQVKPITIEIKQINDDSTYFIYSFYSFDSKLIKVDNVCHYDEKNIILGCYSRLTEDDSECKTKLNFFMENLNNSTTNKLIQYFENPKLYVEFYI